MGKTLTPEQQRLILQVGIEMLASDPLMGYTSGLGGGSRHYWHNGTGVWIDATGDHPWTTEGLPFITWKAVRAHGANYPAEHAELRTLRAEQVHLQGAVPSWPWGAPAEAIAAHEKLRRDNWAEQKHVRQEMKTLVRTMLAAGDPDQPMNLLEVAGIAYETVPPPPRKHREAAPPAVKTAPAQGLLF